MRTTYKGPSPPLLLIRKRKKRLTKKRFSLLLIFACACLACFFAPTSVSAEDQAQAEFYETVYEEIAALSGTDMEKLLQEMTEEQRALFENKGWQEVLTEVVQGEFSLSYESVADFLLAIFKSAVGKYVALSAGIVGIAVLTSLLTFAKSSFMEEGVGNVIFYAGYALILALTLVSVFAVTESALNAVTGVQRQMAVLLPVMLAFLTGAGGSASGGVYASATAFLSNGILSVFTSVLFPILKVMILLAVLGHVTEGLKLSELFSFFGSVCKWLLATSLAVYSLLLGVQGITAATHDGVSYKLLKYTVGSGIPLVGGTVRDGLDVVLASCLVVKNAVGYFALILLLGFVLSATLKILAFSWTLKLSSGVLQPLGQERTCGFLSKIGTVLNYYVAITVASGYLYAVTVFAVISSGAGIV